MHRKITEREALKQSIRVGCNGGITFGCIINMVVDVDEYRVDLAQVDLPAAIGRESRAGDVLVRLPCKLAM